jgi:hypothetical protein
MHRRTRRFRKCLDGLPEPIRELSEKSFQLLKANPSHPSLHFKKIGRFWSARVGLDHRALAVEDDKGFIWVWIGRHDDYERMIRETD